MTLTITYTTNPSFRPSLTLKFLEWVTETQIGKFRKLFLLFDDLDSSRDLISKSIYFLLLLNWSQRRKNKEFPYRKKFLRIMTLKYSLIKL